MAITIAQDDYGPLEVSVVSGGTSVYSSSIALIDDGNVWFNSGQNDAYVVPPTLVGVYPFSVVDTTGSIPWTPTPGNLILVYTVLFFQIGTINPPWTVYPSGGTSLCLSVTWSDTTPAMFMTGNPPGYTSYWVGYEFSNAQFENPITGLSVVAATITEGNVMQDDGTIAAGTPPYTTPLTTTYIGDIALFSGQVAVPQELISPPTLSITATVDDTETVQFQNAGFVARAVATTANQQWNPSYQVNPAQFASPTSSNSGYLEGTYVQGSVPYTIGKITPSGTITTYPLAISYGGSQQCVGVAQGLPGVVWQSRDVPRAPLDALSANIGYTDENNNGFTGFVAGTQSAPVSQFMALGPDGNMWYCSTGTVNNITPGGTVTSYAAPVLNSQQIVSADGKLWFGTNINGPAPTVSSIDLNGTITNYAMPTSYIGNTIALGADGNLWVTGLETSPAYIQGFIRVTPTGTITTFFPTPPAGTQYGFNFLAQPSGDSEGIWAAGLMYDASFNLTSALFRCAFTGEITAYPFPNQLLPYSLCAGLDSTLWCHTGPKNFTSTRWITKFTVNVAPPALPPSYNVQSVVLGGATETVTFPNGYSAAVVRMPYVAQGTAVLAGSTQVAFFTAPQTNAVVNLPGGTTVVSVQVPLGAPSLSFYVGSMA